MRLFNLFHFTYAKGTGLYLQRTASVFGCVLRGATRDGLWWAGESGLKLREKRRFALGYVYAINRLQY